jgi:hypothetical protein
MRVRSLVLGALFGLGGYACGGPSAAAPDYTMTGTWRQSGDLRDSVTGTSHIHEGTYTLAQSGDGFAGTGRQWGACGGAHGSFIGPLAEDVPFPVTEGRVVGTTVSFKTNICSFTGSFENGNPRRITGTATCSYVQDGTTYNFAGEWQADR